MKFKIYNIEFLSFFFIGQVICNYPDGQYNPRPCCQNKYTVRYSGQICVPSKDGWIKESEQRCKENLKKECPEFNEASCMWQNIVLCGKNISFPACKLRYYATEFLSDAYTWMEIMYVNQYGTVSPDKSIIEIHRLIKRHETFRDKDQPDYPANVPDPNESQGLDWEEVYSDEDKKPNKTLKICENQKDTGSTCSDNAKNFMLTRFHDVGIGYYKDTEINSTGKCDLYYINKIIRDVCRIKYSKTINIGYGIIFEQQLAEYMIYNDKNNNVWVYRQTVYGGNSITSDSKLIR